MAAWLRALWTGADDRGRGFDLSDPVTGALKGAIGGTDEPALVAERALELREVFGEDLAGDERFRTALEGALTELTGGGSQAAVTALVNGDGHWSTVTDRSPGLGAG